MKKKEWFASWFDSPFYHVLYQNHNETEAQQFMDNLLQQLDVAARARVLDLACGKGRHSRYLATKQLRVTGVDLSENSIKFAQQFESEQLEFYQHDMRKDFRINYFDYIFNLFTSFGYFDDDRHNLQTLRSVEKGLHTGGGVFVLDYFNSEHVRQALKPHYQQTAGGIDFHIRKHIKNGYIFKNIDFEANGNEYHFQERVRLFEIQDFEQLFAAAGLKIIQKFGNYQLDAFDLQQSPRLVLVAQKM
jgi:SAM-dependent methyltransferase